ncbi:MAG: hemerythrin domain-containing protein, partial [Solirubrobacterales bacterium]
DPAGEAIVRVLTDHVWIRARIAALREAGDPSVAELRELGERLDAHVRHEERVLFPEIALALAPEPRESLAAAVAAAEAAG